MRQVQLYRREGNGRWGTDIPIPLLALVDDEDYDRVVQFHPTWRLHSAGYACCTKRVDGKSVVVLMHRFITGQHDRWLQTDHIDRNRLNNQRSNLRVVSPKENSENRFWAGVGPFRGGWRAWTKSPTLHLGVFDTEEEANAALQLWLDQGIRPKVRVPEPPVDALSKCCNARVVRNGRYRGIQRYRCENCKRTFKE